MGNGLEHAYQIHDAARVGKKVLHATSRQQCIRKGCKKLKMMYGPEVRLVLDADGTEVKTEEQFNSLPYTTCFVLLRDKEWYRSKNKIPKSIEDNSHKFFLDCCPRLVDLIVPDRLLPLLEADEVLTREEVTFIQSESSVDDQNRLLLKYLKSKSLDYFAKFWTALDKTDQRIASDILLHTRPVIDIKQSLLTFT